MLLSGTSGGIIDSSTQNNFEGFGSASISTAVTKFSGYSSIAFNGTTDYVYAQNSPVYYFGTGDFTIEAWIYRAGNSGNQPICQGDVIGSSTNDKWWFAVNNTGLIFSTHASGGFSVQTTTTFTLNSWYYVAVTRSSGTMYMFVNGVSTSFSTSGTPSGYTLNQNGLAVGGMSTPSYWNGYISDLRVTKGYARYTATFTPPTNPLPIH